MIFTLDQIEVQSVPIYHSMGQRGIRMDQERLALLVGELTKASDVAQKELKNLTGFTIRSHSSKDQASLLDWLGIAYPDTSRGNPSITLQFLERYQASPVIAQLIELKQSAHRLSQVKSVMEKVRNGRVHPTYMFRPELGRPHSGGGVNPMSWF